MELEVFKKQASLKKSWKFSWKICKLNFKEGYELAKKVFLYYITLFFTLFQRILLTTVVGGKIFFVIYVVCDVIF